ncbi:hypothetical protein P7C71_g5017, partial [Lecanoromycetidae sp. Uapishka_2]
MALLNGQAASQPVSAFALASIASSALATKPQTDQVLEKQKTKRGIADPLDASKLPAKRPRKFRAAALTKRNLTRHNSTSASPQAAPTGIQFSPVFERFYNVTAPRATADDTAPTALKATSHTFDPTIAASAIKASRTKDVPPARIEYDLNIRQSDPAAWAQWAADLYEEIGSLRHVRDLGYYTVSVIAMMKEDEVWPKDDVIGQ